MYHLVVVLVWPSRDGVVPALCQQSLLDSLQIRGKCLPGLHFTEEAEENCQEVGIRKMQQKLTDSMYLNSSIETS